MNFQKQLTFSVDSHSTTNSLEAAPAHTLGHRLQEPKLGIPISHLVPFLPLPPTKYLKQYQMMLKRFSYTHTSGLRIATPQHYRISKYIPRRMTTDMNSTSHSKATTVLRFITPTLTTSGFQCRATGESSWKLPGVADMAVLAERFMLLDTVNPEL